MKRLILAWAIVGMAVNANAQSSAHSKFAKNYHVCTDANKYEICSAAEAMATGTGRTGSPEVAYLSMRSTYVHLGNSTRGNARFRGRIRVTYDEPGAAYKGKESMVNDGVDKNKVRNINTNNGGYDLPPNDGGSSMQ